MQNDNEKLGDKLAGSENEVCDERRDFLKKCGKFAAYSAPVMATLLLFDRKKAHAEPPVSNPDS